MAVLVGTVLLLAAAGCGGSGGEKQVTGFVLDAVERSLTEIETLRLRDDSGKVWEFSTLGSIGISASHLRLHQVTGERVVVTYSEVGGRLIASDASDAGPGG